MADILKQLHDALVELFEEEEAPPAKETVKKKPKKPVEDDEEPGPQEEVKAALIKLAKIKGNEIATGILMKMADVEKTKDLEDEDCPRVLKKVLWAIKADDDDIEEFLKPEEEEEPKKRRRRRTSDDD